jgi:uncharacterized protein DUF3168
MSIPDPIGDIVTLLLADDAVTALVDERVFGAELPAEEAKEMPRAAVVVSPAGGPGRPGTVKYRRLRVDTTCFGVDLLESWQVHAAVREALETLAHRDGSLFSILMASEAANARDQAKQWPTCYASYRVLTATAL